MKSKNQKLSTTPTHTHTPIAVASSDLSRLAPDFPSTWLFWSVRIWYNAYNICMAVSYVAKLPAIYLPREKRLPRNTAFSSTYFGWLLPWPVIHNTEDIPNREKSETKRGKKWNKRDCILCRLGSFPYIIGE